MSLKRIEHLLEEVIFQQILTRNNGNLETANEVFRLALKNVQDVGDGYVKSVTTPEDRGEK